MSKIITVRNLQKAYRLPKSDQKNGITEFQAVKGISFEVAQGEIFGILGPNGAGKTTTLEILEGLKPPGDGMVSVLGLDTVKDRVKVQQNIGVQLQSSEYLRAMTLTELLQLFASLYGKTADVDQLLGFVNLVEKKHSFVNELSGGQKQRFTIATALVNEPKVLFLDEPTTGLDPRARRDIWELVKRINQQGVTIILTTHYMEEAEYLCGRVAIMDAGLILAIDNPKKLIEDLSYTTQVSFLTDQKLESTIWEGIQDLQNSFTEYPKTILEVKELSAVSAILQRLAERRIPFSSFSVKTATLEDVYLHLTGKTYED